MKKHILFVLMIFLITIVVITGCNGKLKYENGIYFAQSEDFDQTTGFNDFVVVTIKNGKITDAYWSGTNIQVKGDKKELSKNKAYGMVEEGGASAYWYEQAKAVEDWLIENQNADMIKKLYSDTQVDTSEIKTDAGTSVSIHVSEFYKLVQKALEAGPVPKGQYDMDTYVINNELPKQGHGNTYKGEFIVVNGTIVSVNFNAMTLATDENGNYLSKKELKEKYGMKSNGNAKHEWYEQAQFVEEYILENQELKVSYIDDSGHTDAITNVSIHVNEFEELFNKAFVKNDEEKN